MTRQGGAGSGGLVWYVIAATLARTADGGGVVAGVFNSYFFASTLAAHSEYSPLPVRGQVFVWVGAPKITAGSAGTAAAGSLVSHAAHPPLAAAALLTVVFAVIAVTDRAVTDPRRVEGRL